MANFNFPNELTESIRLNITFVVEKDGSLTDIKLSSSIGYGIPEEVQRVLVSSPKWEPGYDKGKPVRSLFRFPITLQFE
ncbi:Gram-negative bacterial tonB protein [compost metagenome]